MADNNAAEVFVYTDTGVGEGAVVPEDVVRVRIDPSVLAIREKAFFRRHELQEVELHDGLRDIGSHAFEFCRALNELRRSDGVEKIGQFAFYFAASLNSEIRHQLPQSLTACSTVVKKCFPWSYQKMSLAWNNMLSAIAVHYEILPSHSTTSFIIVLSISAMTYYTFSTHRMQL
jgi:hypothetical protein